MLYGIACLRNFKGEIRFKVIPFPSLGPKSAATFKTKREAYGFLKRKKKTGALIQSDFHPS